MKTKLVVTDDQGNTFEHDFALVATEVPRCQHTKKRSVNHKPAPSVSVPAGPRLAPSVDLSLPVRPFMKKHGAGLGGPQRFALLVARMAKGDLNTEVALSTIEKQWNKMKGIMGASFNRSTTSRAKDSGWVDSPRAGYYVLLPGWEGLLNHA